MNPVANTVLRPGGCPECKQPQGQIHRPDCRTGQKAYGND
jgi:hypothetical protein